MNALRSVLNNREPQGDEERDEERGILDSFGEATTLSWNTRVKLFIAFFAAGIFFSLFGSFCLFFPGMGLSTFAAFYTIGNISSIGSTMFLVGPLKQLKNMFDSKRLVATIVMISALILTFVAAFVVKSSALALIMVIIQSLAMTWYALSYIKFARDIVIKFFNACLG